METAQRNIWEFLKGDEKEINELAYTFNKYLEQNINNPDPTLNTEDYELFQSKMGHLSNTWHIFQIHRLDVSSISSRSSSILALGPLDQFFALAIWVLNHTFESVHPN